MKKSRVRDLRSKMGAAEKYLNKVEWVLCMKYPELVMFLQAQKQFDSVAKTYQAAWNELTQAQRNDLIPEFWDSSKMYKPKPKGEIRAHRRDMPYKEFEAALERRGFKDVMHGVKVSSNHTVGIVMEWRKGEYVLDRRATLARAIKGARKDAK